MKKINLMMKPKIQNREHLNNRIAKSEVLLRHSKFKCSIVLLFPLFLFLYLILSTQYSFAQTPQGINYQGVARNAAGKALSNQSIAVQFKLWQGNPNLGGSLIYTELYAPVLTDTFGLYSLVIGKGASISAQTFSQVPWASGNIWVQVYIDPAGGSAYNLISSQQLMSVPYALYAASAGSGGGGTLSGKPNNIPKINSAGNGIKNSLIYENSDSSSIGINTTNPQPGAVLDIFSTKKGLLIPRMTDAQRGAITNKHHGLMVFQTNATTFAPQGFWYYDSTFTSWFYLPPAQAVWTIQGNYGTIPGTHFIGTIDNKDLVFKTGTSLFSPIERMRILNASGQIEFGTPGTEYIFPAAKGSAGQILQLDPTGLTNNLLWKNPSGGLPPWVRSGGLIYPANLTDTVGIGTNNPQSTLDIFSTNNKGALNVSYNGISTLPAITFNIQNAGNGSTVLDVVTLGAGEGIRAKANSGSALSGKSLSGPALWVQNSSSTASTVDAENTGGHAAGYFHNNFTGADPTLIVTNGGTGYAGSFSILNPANDSTALIASTKGKGSAMFGYTIGTGSAGVFAVNNTSSTSSGLFAITNGNGKAIFGVNSGRGYAGVFYINNSLNDSAALAGATNGKGPAVFGYNTGLGNAGNFQINNTINAATALNVSTNGGGFSGSFSGGKGLKTDNFIMTNTSGIAGSVLTATNTLGNAAWTPLPGTTNFSAPVNSTAQTFAPSTATVQVNFAATSYTNGGANFIGNIFTAGAAGVYHFDVQITITNQTILSAGAVILALFNPSLNTAYKQIQYNVPATGGIGSYSQPLGISADINLAAGQKVDIRLSNTSTGTTYVINTNPSFSWFSGHRIF